MKYTKIVFPQLDKEQLQALEGLLSTIEEITGSESDQHSMTAYCLTQDVPTEALNEIAVLLNIGFETSTFDEENWNADWEASFHPIAIDDFVYILADFHELPTTKFEHLIHITPKMSFGTGHHDTTQLVMKQMRHLDFTGKKVFDFGTGTGVLAVLAEQRGATHILATDNDAWSIENSIENIARNNCQHIEISDQDIVAIPTYNPFDMILANINRQILLTYMPQLSALLTSGGTIIFSGFLKEDIPLITASIEQNRLTLCSTHESNNWICIEAKK